MLWRNEDFSCVWKPFEFWSFNNLCLVFSQKINNVAKYKNLTFSIKSTFFFKSPMDAMVNKITAELLLLRHVWYFGPELCLKKAPRLNCSIKGFSVKLNQFSHLFVQCSRFPQKNKTNTGSLLPTQSQGLHNFLLIYERSNKLETFQVLLALFCLKKYLFVFLLMLRTYSAEVCQKKLYPETEIAQHLKQLQGRLKVA